MRMTARAKIGARRDSLMRTGGRRFSCESTPVGALSTPIHSLATILSCEACDNVSFVAMLGSDDPYDVVALECVNCELMFKLRRPNNL